MLIWNLKTTWVLFKWKSFSSLYMYMCLHKYFTDCFIFNIKIWNCFCIFIVLLYICIDNCFVTSLPISGFLCLFISLYLLLKIKEKSLFYTHTYIHIYFLFYFYPIYIFSFCRKTFWRIEKKEEKTLLTSNYKLYLFCYKILREQLFYISFLYFYFSNNIKQPKV